MRIGLLGAFEASDDTGRPVEIPGTRLRALLACLALNQGRLVTAESLLDAIWGDEPPSGASNALHSLVARLRRALPPDDAARVESLPAGYRLSVAAEATDVAEFERLAAEGRACRDAGNADAAADRFASALGLWRGAPLADLSGVPFAGPTVARLTELRLRTIEDHAELALASGRAGELIGDLLQLTVAHPLDERLRRLYIRALCAVGRPAEALSAFEDLRRSLAESLGTDPSPALRDLHAAILRGGHPLAGREPAARRGGPDPGTSREPARRTNLTAAATSFVGREQDLAQIGALQQASGSSDFTELAEHPDPWLSATGYQYRGFAAELRGDAKAAAAAFAVARDKFTAIGDGWGAAGAVRHLGAGHGLGGDHGAALAASDQAIRFADAVGAEDDAAWMRAARGMVLLRAGDLAAARADLSSARTSGHALRSVMVIAFAETGLGEVSRHSGDLAQARSLLNAARRRLDEAAGVPQRIRLLPLVGLARLAAVGGELAEEREFLAEALRRALAVERPLNQDRPAIATVAEALADLALADGRPADAVRLLGYAAAVRGAPDQGNPDVRRVETAARTALDGEYDGLYVQAVNTSADAAVTEITVLARELTGRGPAG